MHASVTARKDYWMVSAIAQTFSERDDERRFARPSQCEISNADDRMMQSKGG